MSSQELVNVGVKFNLPKKFGLWNLCAA